MEELISSPNTYAGLQLSFKEGFIILFYAFLAGFLIRFLYIRFSNSFSSKSAYANTLLMVTVCVASLIAVVKSSLALSLGLVGALSVVRFRTAVKEPYTLSFILLSVCLGIAIGAGQNMFALSVGIVGTFISIYTNQRALKGNKKTAKNNEVDTLSISADNDEAIFKALEVASLSVKTYSIKNISSNPNSECLATVGVYIESNEILKRLIKEISKQPGIKNVTFYNSPV